MLFTNKTVIFSLTTATSLGAYVLDSKLWSRFNSTPYGAMWTYAVFYHFKTAVLLQKVGFILWCVLGSREPFTQQFWIPFFLLVWFTNINYVSAVPGKPCQRNTFWRRKEGYGYQNNWYAQNCSSLFCSLSFPGLCPQQSDICTNVLSSPYFQDVLN